jgi:peptide deformylase
MIKELVKDEAVLSKKCTRATADDAEVAQDLIDTMKSIEDCACLAANQIGATVAMGVYVDDSEDVHVIYNPRIMMGLGAQKLTEGCLTRDEPSKVTRYAKVKVAFDELVDGELVSRKRDFVGWTGQMIQHICDHCQGKLV